MHVGTFTREGTWAAAAGELPELARLGITLIEMMPVAEFEGRFGWGYDGVDLFAPTHLYGRPDDLPPVRRSRPRARPRRHPRRRLQPLRAVRQLPARVLARILHRSRTRTNGATPSTSTATMQRRCGSFSSTNAGYWIDEFHLDGLRLDATQQIFDRSAGAHHRGDRTTRARRAARIAQRRARRGERAAGYAAGAAVRRTAATGSTRSGTTTSITARWSRSRDAPRRTTATRTASRRSSISAAKYGYLFQGQHYAWQRQPRGTPACGLRAGAVRRVSCRITIRSRTPRAGRAAHQLTSPGRWRAMTALLLLMPATPMLFQGQEFSSSAPFLYFADFDAESRDRDSQRARRVPARSFRASSTRGARGARRSRRARRRSSGASSISRARAPRATRIALHRRSAASAARGRGVSGQRAPECSTARCSHRRAFVLRSSRTTTRTIACSS